jgi:WD repeat-containing protein 6
VSYGDLSSSRPVLSNSEDYLAFLGTSDGNLFLLSANEGTLTFVTALNMSISWLAIAASTDASGLSTTKLSSDTLTRVYCVVAFCEGTGTAKAVWIQLRRDVEGRTHLDSSEEAGRDVSSPPWEIDAKDYSLDLPETFTPKSARVLNYTGALVLGSRQSTIAIYKPLNDMENSYLPPQCYRHVHGDDTVTSISCIRTTEYPEDRDFFLTTGRNGTYAVHSVHFLGSHPEYLPRNEITLVFETLDCSTTLFSSGIEGSYCAQRFGPTFKPSKEFPPLGEPGLDFWFRHFEGMGRSNSGDLILYGFNAKKFVVWNESHQSLVFSTDCGNEHRPWAYNTYTPAVPAGKLNFPHHGPFAWTQAGSFNIVSIGQPDHFTIQQGGHGREIKALAISPLPYQSLCHGIRNGTLIATGAEDTAIRFFIIGASKEAHAHNKMVCLRTEKKHITGLQSLSFSSCGSYLFSSGGREELYAWRIRHGVPGVNLGVLLDCTFPKETAASDLRITDLGVRNQGSGCFVVSVIYSNSMIKFFRYTTSTPPSKSTCELLRCFFYQDNCLTQINDCAESGTLTASTDGHLALWSGPGERCWLPAFCESPALGKRGLEPYRHRVHQNSIKVMFTVSLPSKSGQRDQIVVTGGDDNALGLTLMRTHTSGGDATPSRPITSFQTLLIPKAHAAAVTAMCLCTVSFSPLQEFRIRFLSTGNDQRVKLWSVSIHIEKLGLSRYNSDIGSDAMSALGKFPPTNCDQAWVARDIDVLPKSTFSQNPIHFS